MKKTVNNTTDKIGPAKGAGRIAGRIACIFLLTLTIALLIIATPHFSISEIKVSGNNYYSDSQIVAKSGLRTGQNGFTALRGNNIFKIISFRCDAAEDSVISACPYIKSINIRYILPAAIQIEVEERNKSVVIPYFGTGLLIDGEGVVVDIVRNYSQTGLPVASGLSVSRYEIGKAIAVRDELKIDAILSVVNALRQADRDSDEALAWRISEIDVSDMKNILLKINNGIDINLGDGTELYYRVSAVKEILVHGIDEGEEGVIVFSNGARPVFVPGAAGI